MHCSVYDVLYIVLLFNCSIYNAIFFTIGWIHGITLFSKRADSIAAWMDGFEISHVKADLLTRQLILNIDINSQYVIAPLLDVQKKEAQIYEKGRLGGDAKGYHFLSVQYGPESEGVEGFWLLRELTSTV